MSKDYIIVLDSYGGTHLEHRSHKYTKREWQGKGWRYWYGTQYKKDAAEARVASDAWKQQSKRLNEQASKTGNEKFFDNFTKNARAGAYDANLYSAAYARTAYNSQKLYEKSLAGRIEKGKKTVERLLSKLKTKAKSLFTPKTTVTTSYNSVGGFSKPSSSSSTKKTGNTTTSYSGTTYFRTNNSNPTNIRSRKKNVTGNGTGLYRRTR